MRSAATAIKKGTCNVQVFAVLNVRRSVMATIAWHAVERTLGLQSYEGTILTILTYHTYHTYLPYLPSANGSEGCGHCSWKRQCRGRAEPWVASSDECTRKVRREARRRGGPVVATSGRRVYPGNQYLSKDKTPENRVVHLDRQIQGEASDGGLIIHIRATLAFSAIYPAD